MAAAFGSFVMESSNETCITKPLPASAPMSTSVPAAAPTAGVAALASGRAAPASPGASSATPPSVSQRRFGGAPAFVRDARARKPAHDQQRSGGGVARARADQHDRQRHGREP